MNPADAMAQHFVNEIAILHQRLAAAAVQISTLQNEVGELRKWRHEREAKDAATDETKIEDKPAKVARVS